MNTAQPARFAGRLAVQQRVLPAYRAAFFKRLALRCDGGLSVFAGLPHPSEQIPAAERLEAAEWVRAANRSFMRPGSALFQCFQPGLAAWLERCKPDALVVEANPRYRSTPVAVRRMHTRGRPVLGWGLGAPPVTGALAGWRLAARRKFLAAFDGMIAYSRSGAEQYRALGFSPERVFIAPNAAAAPPAAPPPERPLPLTAAPQVLFVGRLQARKRIDLLLHACAALPEGLRPALRIVGDGPARGELEDLARRVYPAAEFSGALYGAALDACFARADLFALPGTGGLAVQQAMAWGLPVIVAEGDGTQGDLVRPANGLPSNGLLSNGLPSNGLPSNGLLIPPGDRAALTAALQTALSDLPALRRMGAASYKIVAEEINLDTMVDGFIRAVCAIHSRFVEGGASVSKGGRP